MCLQKILKILALCIQIDSDNIEIFIANEIDQIIEKIFNSLLQRYQKRSEEKMRGSEFVYDGIDLLHYKLHKVNLNVVDHT